MTEAIRRAGLGVEMVPKGRHTRTIYLSLQSPESSIISTNYPSDEHQHWGTPRYNQVILYRLLGYLLFITDHGTCILVWFSQRS